MYQRFLGKIITENLFTGYIIVVYGARQVGKTTLVKSILNQHTRSKLYLNCDESDIREILKPTNYTDLINKIGKPELLVIDEAQRVENIGLTLKILFDNNPKMQIIATGSSSFELANKISEPLTGRSLEYKLYPLSVAEILQESKTKGLEASRILPKILKYGLYPKIFTQPELGLKKKLENLTSQYLYKDLLEFDKIKKPNLLLKLLKALAFQVGSEVSYGSLANMFDCEKGLIERYIDLLEKTFVIYKLPAFAKNSRKEITKGKKIYFVDLGIRNAIIESFPDLELGLNIGGLWENFLILEKLKYLEYKQQSTKCYFWRTYEQAEIDYLEEENGLLSAFEFKWSSSKSAKLPQSFTENYPNTNFKVINKENWWQWLEIL